MRAALEFCLFLIAFFLAIVALFLLATALGYGESIWEPLAALGLAAGIMGLMGLQKTGGELEDRAQQPTLRQDSII